MKAFNNLGRLGWYKDENNLITFQMGNGHPMATETTGIIDVESFNTILSPVILNIGDKYILIKGSNNRLPDEIESTIGNNRILPEIIEKQTRILYGKGPRLYIERFENGKLIREWQKQPIIENWFESWQYNGLQDNIKDFCEKIIHDYYYFEDYWIRWRFFRSRMLKPDGSVAGLEHIENRRCRLATEKNMNHYAMDLEDKDFNHVVVGNWLVAMEKRFNIYNRLRLVSPTDNEVAVSYHKNHTVGQIYGYNRFYFGIKDWLTGTNRNPQYINSYLENSLNAKVHVVIPWRWVEIVDEKIKKVCDENAKLLEAGKTLIKLNGIEIGTEYSVTYRDQYVAAEMQKLSSFLTGVKNQGKMYASYSFITNEGKEASWQINPIDLKYREYITALIDYDKRADEVITTSIGMDAALSNISKDGVISKSGSDLYYNYIIYLYNLTLAEETCTEPLNQAIKINFPNLYAQGFRVGFYNEVPGKQEDISPNDRLQNSFNRSVQEIMQLIKQQNEKINNLQTEIKK